MAIAMALALQAGGAAGLTPPDPATLRMPDMTPTRDQGVIANGWVHFYFHKEGVSYADAYADFADCYRFLASGSVGMAPTFVPWGGRPATERAVPNNQYGLMGAVMGSIFAAPMQRRAWQSRMRRCLEPRGYVRYPINAESWRRLVDDHSLQSIALQALAASGPKPDLPVVTR